MVSPARLNPPPVFKGARDGFSALAWLLAVNRYFTLAKVEEADRTPHALSYLDTPGPARWFDGCGLADTCDFEKEFTPAFKKEYIPHNFAGNCRRALTSLRMTSDFPTFLTTFKDLLGALLGYAENESAKATVNEFAQTSFIDNCPLALQQLIEGYILQHPSITLSDLFQYATEMDRIYSFKPNSPTHSSAPLVSSLASFSSSSSQATPMEIDHISVQLHNINKRFDRLEKNNGRNNHSSRNNNNNNYNNYKNNNNNNNNNGHPARLNDNERQRLINTGGCFRCRQIGHMGPNCPIFGNNGNNNNRQGRWVFQLLAGDASESGNAPDAQA
ncbi:hypothetical protein BGZ97_004763 [Linnemannia gamsii]|jgi:hypothetical protein|uniref:CCHC-type domain-containing protein n=1 Tax=Linnemannia gamsii TaxID=64522 RepID=A0A9P6UGP6_9FUNG|nr:hypothetical protein BGZ97_004763 [Linnemannia gamsii]